MCFLFLAYVMRHMQISLMEAFSYVKLRRRLIQPNDGYPHLIYLSPFMITFSRSDENGCCSRFFYLLLSSHFSFHVPFDSFMKQLVHLEQRLYGKATMGEGDWVVGMQKSGRAAVPPLLIFSFSLNPSFASYSSLSIEIAF